jgi:hypothetical protein
MSLDEFSTDRPVAIAPLNILKDIEVTPVVSPTTCELLQDRRPDRDALQRIILEVGTRTRSNSGTIVGGSRESRAHQDLVAMVHMKRELKIGLFWALRHSGAVHLYHGQHLTSSEGRLRLRAFSGGCRLGRPPSAADQIIPSDIQLADRAGQW